MRFNSDTAGINIETIYTLTRYYPVDNTTIQRTDTGLTHQFRVQRTDKLIYMYKTIKEFAKRNQPTLRLALCNVCRSVRGQTLM